ncbi:MAG TPA: glucose-1-phosphate adenylyltransferase [Candidatus Marinimicrobia bacterium]|nr:glucose-1-phosphate adenylyltransferase [Candidatus Neomarinimicrobiota bacterium]HRS51103.1 glucose-1-phosphate adenylyltransferase [Candidatus Neomarinimicrobiota bacterium]HRU92818.1 glucose-1-phosphate adenylyltransferase [Candidatus Neomarinimicrobiota bacterium]
MKSNDVLAIILGGGKGTRLYPLTKYRAKPAVPFGGKFRIIDVPISNCLNSGINKIYILTQFNTHSLHRHIYSTYSLGPFTDGFVDILAAQQTMENADWYQGTADAVRKNLPFINEIKAAYTMILSGDHLYRMDYRLFLEHHIKNKAEITVAVKPVSRQDAGHFGILQTNQQCRIVRFVEKPNSELLDSLKSPGLPAETPFLASMGIYIFATETLHRILEQNPSDDFGKNIIPSAIDNFNVCSYRFDGYWRDIGTIESFFTANLELARFQPPFSMYLERAPIYTRARSLPASRLENCTLNQTLLADGCYLAESRISESVVGIRTIIRKGASIEKCVIMGADYFEQVQPEGLPQMGIGRNCVIRNAIIDKNARIGDNVQIINRDHLKEYDSNLYSIRDGIVVIPKNTTIPEGMII